MHHDDQANKRSAAAAVRLDGYVRARHVSQDEPVGIQAACKEDCGAVVKHTAASKPGS